MPSFKFFLSLVGTCSFYFLDMHGAHLTEKMGHTQHFATSLNKLKLEGLYWNAAQNNSNLRAFLG